MQRLADGINTEGLLHFLDIAKMAAKSDRSEFDDERDETICDKDSKIDEEKIDLNTVGIMDLYVSLIILTGS